jgi:hypothetical protein
MDLRSLVPIPKQDVEAAQGIIATLIFIAIFTVAIGVAALDISRLVAGAFSASAG